MKIKLYYAALSPFARKPRVIAIAVTVSPLNPNADLARENPLIKVPTLVTDDGTALFDSRVICEYLDTLHSGRKFFPVEGHARWQALRLQALSDGIMDAAVLCRYEAAVRPEQYQWSDWRKGQLGKISRGIAVLEHDAAKLEGELSIGNMTAACALDYLDFRLPEVNWRDSAPKLAQWFAKVSKRPSLVATAPKA